MAETADQPTPRSEVPKTGMGNGAMVAAGVMFAGGVFVAGVGVGAIASSGSQASAVAGEGTVNSQPASDQGPGSTDDPVESGGSQSDSRKEGPGEVTVTLPDTDGNGIADALENDEVAIGDPDEGKPDEKATEGGDVSSNQTYVYIIESGDTLTEISGETGVPLGTLVETNDIQNPNLIYAGAALLISPAG